MSKNIKGIIVEIGGETSSLEKALKGVNGISRDLQTELKSVEKLLKLDPTNTELLEQKQRILAEAVGNTSDKLDKLKEAEIQVQRQFAKGEVSEGQYRALKREIISTEESLKSLGDKAQETSKKFDFLGENSGKFNDVMKNATIGAVGAAGAVLALADSTREYREDMAKLDINAKEAGASLESTHESLKRLNQISGETDSNIEALSNLLQAGFTDNEMQEALDALSGAVIKFPDTLKIEGLADGLQETLATGKAAGSFSEMLERLGYNLDDFNAGLAESADQGESQQYILDTLAKTGLADVSAGYRDANEALIDTKNAQFELNDSMAEIGTMVEPVIGNLLVMVTMLLSTLIDNKDSVVVALAAIAAGLLAFNVVTMIQGVVGAIQAFQIANEGATVAQTLLNLAMKANPIGLIVSLIVGLIAAIVVLWNTNEDFRNFIINIWENILTFFENSFNWLTKFFGATWGAIQNMFKSAWNSIVTFFMKTVPEWLEAMIEWFNELPRNLAIALLEMMTKVLQFGIDLWNWTTTEFVKVLEEFMRFFGELPGKVWEVLLSIMIKLGEWLLKAIDWVVTEIPKFILAFMKFYIELPFKVWEAIIKIIEKLLNLRDEMISWAVQEIPKFVDKFIELLSALPVKVYDVGVNIIKGIWDGINSMIGWITDKVTSFVNSMVAAMKGVLRIQSPSRVMADEIGKYMAQGIGVGFEDEMKSVSNQMSKAVPKNPRDFGDGGNHEGGGTRQGGKVVNQTLNVYSPKALSPAETARQTRIANRRLVL